MERKRTSIPMIENRIKPWTAEDARNFRERENSKFDRIRPLVNLGVTFALKPLARLACSIVGEEAVMGRAFDRVTRGINANLDTAYATYTPIASDVLSVGYFRSGTNWTMHTCFQIANLGEGEFDHIQDVIPWPDAPVPEKGVGLNDPETYQSPTGLRVIKSHNLPRQIPVNDEAKFIAVTRDPKDVAVSGYHLFRSFVFGKMMPSPSMWLDRFLSDNPFFGAWHDFTAGWYALRDQPNVLFLTYEQMKADPDTVIRRIAKVMGVDLTPLVLEKIKYKTSFDHMKTINHKFYPANRSAFSFEKGEMIRSGKTGSGKELFSDEALAMVDSYFSAKLRELGCSFPYDEIYGGG